MESGSTPPEGKADDRFPRGAIAVVVVGLIATLAAALLSNSGSTGSFAHLEWVQQRPIPDSKPVAVPGSEAAKMKLINGKIQSTGTNIAGYALFRVLSTVRIDKDVKLSEGTTLVCAIHPPIANVLIAQSTGNLRMLYPRSSETGIYGQPVEEEVLARFASHGHLAAVLEATDLGARWTTVKGVKLEWPEYQEGTEHLEYLLPEGKPKAAIELPFYTVWKSTKRPRAQVSCKLKTDAGTATVETAGSLPRVSPPINEEAEEVKQEEREEAEEASGEGGEPEGE